MDRSKRKSTDHPVLWTIGVVGNGCSVVTNWYGVWWLWLILAGIAGMLLLNWWERVRD